MPYPTTSVPKNGHWHHSPHLCSDKIGNFSLIFVIDLEKSRILLGMKKRGFGKGLYNGFGGKPEPGEDMLHCAQRELEEESGITSHPNDLHHSGTIVIARPSLTSASQSIQIAIQVFTLLKTDAEAIETEEMSPRWFPIPDDIPYDQMWPEAKLYLPGILEVAGQNSVEILQAYVEYQWSPNDARAETWRVIASPDKQEYLAGWIIDWSR